MGKIGVGNKSSSSYGVEKMCKKVNYVCSKKSDFLKKSKKEKIFSDQIRVKLLFLTSRNYAINSRTFLDL